MTRERGGSLVSKRTLLHDAFLALAEQKQFRGEPICDPGKDVRFVRVVSQTQNKFSDLEGICNLPDLLLLPFVKAFANFSRAAC